MEAIKAKRTRTYEGLRYPSNVSELGWLVNKFFALARLLPRRLHRFPLPSSKLPVKANTATEQTKKKIPVKIPDVVKG